MSKARQRIVDNLVLFFSLLMMPFPSFSAENQISDTSYVSEFNNLEMLPAFSLTAPSGFTPTENFVSASLGGISNSPGSNQNARGAASLGLGLAFPSDIGLAINVDLGGKFLGERQELALSIGKYFTNLDMSFSAGGRNITMWHNDGSKNTPSFFVAASKLIMLEDTIAIVNVGVGNSDFRTITDAASSESRKTTFSPFASGAYYIFPQLSLIADYTSGIATLGAGYVPSATWPLSLSFGVYDVAKAIPNHNNTSFIASVSSSYTF